LFRLSGWFHRRLVGIDFARHMIHAAKRAASPREDRERFSFQARSVLDDLDFLGLFPQIFTDRCLINLPSPALQIEAVENLLRILRPGGRLALIESTQEGQEKINELRELIGLNRIPYRWHNNYLREKDFLENLPKTLVLRKIDHFASLYFLISRVFNAKLTPDGEEPDYLAEVNKIASSLPSFGEFAPLRLYLFEKSQ
jgi:SAM-dependent methyltransferase